MHDTALIAGKAFCDVYGKEGMTVVDIGGMDINGSLRTYYVSRGLLYYCIDLEAHESVDIVIKPGDKLPFDTNTIDMVISTSCFEHDPCFWLTFKEMTRIVKPDGFIYVSAPSNGPYHKYPTDSGRFYSDTAKSLAYWSSISVAGEEVYPVKIVERFHVYPLTDIWIDCVCVWSSGVCTDNLLETRFYMNLIYMFRPNYSSSKILGHE